jgi:hypothetical protein
MGDKLSINFLSNDYYYSYLPDISDVFSFDKLLSISDILYYKGSGFSGRSLGLSILDCSIYRKGDYVSLNVDNSDSVLIGLNSGMRFIIEGRNYSFKRKRNVYYLRSEICGNISVNGVDYVGDFDLYLSLDIYDMVGNFLTKVDWRKLMISELLDDNNNI